MFLIGFSTFGKVGIVGGAVQSFTLPALRQERDILRLFLRSAALTLPEPFPHFSSPLSVAVPGRGRPRVSGVVSVPRSARLYTTSLLLGKGQKGRSGKLEKALF